jgi:hypothetical protein
MPSEPNLLLKAKRPIGAIAYPDIAMALYVHGLDDKLAKATRICCHLGDGSAVYQIRTQGANCGDATSLETA